MCGRSKLSLAASLLIAGLGAVLALTGCVSGSSLLSPPSLAGRHENYLRWNEGVDPVRLIYFTNGGSRNYAAALELLQSCPMLPDGQVTIDPRDNAILASTESTTSVSGAFIQNLVDAALALEFTDGPRVRQIVDARSPKLFQDAADLPRSKEKYAIGLTGLAGDDTHTVAGRLVHFFTPHVCSIWRFGLYHEEGHRVNGHFKKAISTCKTLHDVEYEADEHAALYTNLTRIMFRNDLINVAAPETMGLSEIDMRLTYHSLGFRSQSSLPGCNYPPESERIRRIKYFIENAVITRASPTGKKSEQERPKARPKLRHDRLPEAGEVKEGLMHYPEIAFETYANVLQATFADEKAQDTLEKCIEWCKSSQGCIAVNFDAAYGTTCQRLTRLFGWKGAKSTHGVIVNTEQCGSGSLPCGSTSSLPGHVGPRL